MPVKNAFSTLPLLCYIAESSTTDSDSPVGRKAPVRRSHVERNSSDSGRISVHTQDFGKQSVDLYNFRSKCLTLLSHEIKNLNVFFAASSLRRDTRPRRAVRTFWPLEAAEALRLNMREQLRKKKFLDSKKATAAVNTFGFSFSRMQVMDKIKSLRKADKRS